MLLTKQSLIRELKKIRAMGWIESRRHGNHGGVGNTLEDLLGIEENNRPIPDAANWELKCQRKVKGRGSSMTTLMHYEPAPTLLKVVSAHLLPKYGWPHKEAGKRHGKSEKSFRQTLCYPKYSDRGFKVEVNKRKKRIEILFNHKEVHRRHSAWLRTVKQRAGLGDVVPKPYWSFSDLDKKITSKLHNCFYVQADVKRQNGKEFFKYEKIFMLTGVSLKNFLECLKDGLIFIDFDARTGKNHGTKFRFKSGQLQCFYKSVEEI